VESDLFCNRMCLRIGISRDLRSRLGGKQRFFAGNQQ